MRPQKDLGWEKRGWTLLGMKVSKEGESMEYLRSEHVCELCPPTRKAENASNPNIVLLETRNCHWLLINTESQNLTLCFPFFTKRASLLHEDQSPFPAVSWQCCWLGLSSHKGTYPCFLLQKGGQGAPGQGNNKTGPLVTENLQQFFLESKTAAVFLSREKLCNSVFPPWGP